MSGNIAFWADVAGILAFIVIVIKPAFKIIKTMILKILGPLIESSRYNKAIKTGKLAYRHHLKLEKRFEEGTATPQERDRYITMRKEAMKVLAENKVVIDYEAVHRAVDQLKNIK